MNALHFSQADEPAFGHAYPPIYNVDYRSRATADEDEAAVQHIVASARRFNPEDGISDPQTAEDPASLMARPDSDQLSALSAS